MCLLFYTAPGVCVRTCDWVACRSVLISAGTSPGAAPLWRWSATVSPVLWEAPSTTVAGAVGAASSLARRWRLVVWSTGGRGGTFGGGGGSRRGGGGRRRLLLPRLPPWPRRVVVCRPGVAPLAADGLAGQRDGAGSGCAAAASACPCKAIGMDVGTSGRAVSCCLPPGSAAPTCTYIGWMDGWADGGAAALVEAADGEGYPPRC